MIKEFFKDIKNAFCNHKIINSILLLIIFASSILISIHLTLDSKHDHYEITDKYVGFKDVENDNSDLKSQYNYFDVKKCDNDGSDILKPKEIIIVEDNDDFIARGIKLEKNSNNLEVSERIFYIDEVALEALYNKEISVIVDSRGTAKRLTKNLDIVGLQIKDTPYICGGIFKPIKGLEDIHFITTPVNAYEDELSFKSLKIDSRPSSAPGGLSYNSFKIKYDANELIYATPDIGFPIILDNRGKSNKGIAELNEGECFISLGLYNSDYIYFDKNEVYDEKNPSEVPLKNIEISKKLNMYKVTSHGEMSFEYKIKGIVLSDSSYSVYFKEKDAIDVIKDASLRTNQVVYVEANNALLNDYHVGCYAISGVVKAPDDILDECVNFKQSISSDLAHLIKNIIFTVLILSIFMFVFINVYLKNESYEDKGRIVKLKGGFKLLIVTLIITFIASIIVPLIVVNVINNNNFMGYRMFFYNIEEALRTIYFTLIVLGFILVLNIATKLHVELHYD